MRCDLCMWIASSHPTSFFYFFSFLNTDMNQIVNLAMILILHPLPSIRCQCNPIELSKPYLIYNNINELHQEDQEKGFSFADIFSFASQADIPPPSSSSINFPTSSRGQNMQDSHRDRLWPNKRIPFSFHHCEYLIFSSSWFPFNHAPVGTFFSLIFPDETLYSDCMLDDMQRCKRKPSCWFAKHWFTGKKILVSSLKTEMMSRMTTGSFFAPIRVVASRSSDGIHPADHRDSLFPFLTVVKMYVKLTCDQQLERETRKNCSLFFNLYQFLIKREPLISQNHHQHIFLSLVFLSLTNRFSKATAFRIRSHYLKSHSEIKFSLRKFSYRCWSSLMR